MATYNSFYGGKRGAPFILVRKYNSVSEMVSYFKLGADYEEVRFDEYVMIDTDDLNDLENGDIYRRGYDVTNWLRRRRICRKNPRSYWIFTISRNGYL